MLNQMLVAVCAMSVLMVFWALVQYLVRKSADPDKMEADVMEGRWGCFGCCFASQCGIDEHTESPVT